MIMTRTVEAVLVRLENRIKHAEEVEGHESYVSDLRLFEATIVDLALMVQDFSTGKISVTPSEQPLEQYGVVGDDQPVSSETSSGSGLYV